MHDNSVLLLPKHLLVLCSSLSPEVLLLLRILSNIILLLTKPIWSLLVRKLTMLYRYSLVVWIILLIIPKLTSNVCPILRLLSSWILLLPTGWAHNAICVFPISSLFLRGNSSSSWGTLVLLSVSVSFTLFVIVRWIIVIFFDIRRPVNSIT